MPRAPSEVAIGAASSLPERQDLRPGLRCGGAGAGDDHHARRPAQRRGGAFDLIVRGRGTEGRHAQLQRRIGSRRVGERAGLDDLALQPVDVEMRRAGRAGHRFPPRLAQQARQVGRGIHFGGELGHRGEQRAVRDFLVGVAVLVCRRLASGDGDHRAAPEPGVLQSGGKVGGADRLREAHRRLAGDARVTVGHVGHRLLAVAQHALYAQRAKFDQRAAHHGIDEEHVRGTVGGQAARQPFGAGDRIGCAHDGVPPLPPRILR